MASTVYDGDESDGRGNLFDGIKFYFKMRLPFRERWMNLVKANAGQIVKLDTQADIVIADHALKDCPAGSVSWKFIEDSVRDGELKDYAKYPAGPSARTSRPAGSAQPTKKGRTPFTNEDDRILVEWVLEAEGRGAATRGNELYIGLEEKNNRHTAQSWRDRWIKFHSHKYRSDSSRGLPAQVPSGPRPAARADQPDQRPALQSRAPNMRSPSPRQSMESENRPGFQETRLPTAPASSLMNVSASKARGVKPYLEKSAGGTKFTNEEMQLLFEEGENIMNLDEDQTINAWIAWAVEHPNHTAQEWRNCFAEVVTPRIKEKAKKGIKKTAPRNEQGGVSTAALRSRSSEPELYRSAAESNLPISVNEAPAVHPTTENARLLKRTEEAFKSRIARVAKGLKVFKVNFNPVICGKTIPLFKLWQTVWSEEFGGCAEVTKRCLWPLVARKLNFNDFRHSSAAKDLERCYREILVFLEDGEEDYETTELSETEEQEMIEDQLRNTAARETRRSTDDFLVIETESENWESDDDLDRRLSLSRQQTPSSSNKRRLGSSHSNKVASSKVWPSIKRQRIDKGKEKELEIPSTPQAASNSDNDGQPRSSHGNPQLEGASSIVLEGIDDDSESELFARPFKQVNLSPTPPRAVQRTLEPETQDFHFPLKPHDELETAAPIPLSHSRQAQNVSRSPARCAKVTKTTSAESRTEVEGELDAFIDDLVDQGYSELHIIRALEATTMNTVDAGIVMKSLHVGKGIPNNMQGVWTSSDDEAVEEKDHARFGEVLGKHGIHRVGLRQRFLADQKAVKNQVESRRLNDIAIHSTRVIG